jgi:hypothetical protein
MFFRLQKKNHANIFIVREIFKISVWTTVIHSGLPVLNWTDHSTELKINAVHSIYFLAVLVFFHGQ